MIPKIIHQIWVGPRQMPTDNMKTWRDHHPSWDYKLWTDDNVPTLRNQTFYDGFGTCYHGKADILRYEILLAQGGVYIDADSTCLRPIDDLLVDDPFDAFACFENEQAQPGLVANGFLGASQGNELMRLIVEEIEARYDHYGPPIVERPAWIITGPALLTQAVEGHQYDRMRIYPSWTFLPEHWSGMKYQGDGVVYAAHKWGSTFESKNDRYDHLET
jgi:mannosyltransferase OCH1-like enzyme